MYMFTCKEGEFSDILVIALKFEKKMCVRTSMFRRVKIKLKCEPFKTLLCFDTAFSSV